jgi:hypothetical protein
VREGFEPSVARLTTAVFKTAALVHYATSPKICFFKNVLPEPDLRYLSKLYALYLSLKANKYSKLKGVYPLLQEHYLSYVSQVFPSNLLYNQYRIYYQNKLKHKRNTFKSRLRKSSSGLRLAEARYCEAKAEETGLEPATGFPARFPSVCHGH